MRVYRCDSCNKVIADPYTVGMKEFYLGVDNDDYFSLIGLAIPVERKRKIKIDLCDVSEACMLLPKKRSVKSNGEKTDIDYDCN